MTSDFKYSIDRMVIRNSRIFGFGWVFHPDRPVKSVNIELRTAEGNSVNLPVVYGKPRDDVFGHYPDSRYSQRCGFVVYGGWPAAMEISEVSLAGEAGGEAFRLPVRATVLSGAIGSSAATQPYRMMMARAWTLLKSGNLKQLLRKAKRYRAGKPGTHGDVVAAVRRQLEKNNCSRFMLVLDHDLGGGANNYREGLIRERMADGCGTLLLSFHLLSLQYSLEICTPGGRQRFSISGLDVLIRLAEEGLISESFYNNAVSFEHPEDVPDLLVTLRSVYAIPLTLAMHDYYPICPSHFLLDASERYCGVPDIETCSHCLPKIDFWFVSFFESRDIRLWRSKWGACLETADTVLCFSHATRDLLLRAYPDLNTDRIDVVPHATGFFPARKPKLDMSTGLHIGILGEIGPHKGCDIVKALSEEIVSQNAATRISVIGTLEADCDPAVVTETGPYEASGLVDLVEASGANVFLFPSIWPETFSYVVDELMQLDVPVVCFDMGAPAERLRHYPKGKLIPLANARDILSQLKVFHEELARPMVIGE
jgi:glycosyltransferase involved in cell wall biosynthesis